MLPKTIIREKGPRNGFARLIKAPLRERFSAKRSARGANCLSPEGEFLRPQRSER
jgi:hypothetical protein